MRPPPEAIDKDVSPAQRSLDHFSVGQPVWIFWKGKWHKAEVLEHGDDAPELLVRCDENLGARLLDGHGLRIGPCSDEIWHRQG